jgi:hypothetical protein
MVVVIDIQRMTVKKIISEIILKNTFLFMDVSSCAVYRILLSTAEIFSITSKNNLLLITDTHTTATILLVYDEMTYNMSAIYNICEL